MEYSLRLGVGRIIITPPVGTNMAGYFPDVVSESVHDDLTATAFCFQQGQTTVLLISVTVCSIGTPLYLRLRDAISAATGVPTEHCIIHAIHTHSGPVINPSNGWGNPTGDYVDTIFLPRIVEAAKKSCESFTPVDIRISQGDSFVGVNRREVKQDGTVTLGQNPQAPFDPKMTIVTFMDMREEPVAHLIHYGCHGTSAGVNHELTRDWAGVMIDAVESKFGGIAAYLNGTEGDVGPRLPSGRTTGNNHVRDAVAHGQIAASDALRICAQERRKMASCLALSNGLVEIPVQKRIPKEVAEEMAKKFAGHTVNLNARKRAYYERVLASYEKPDYEEISSISVEQTIIALGDLAIVTTPFEMFSKIGMEIAKKSPYTYTLIASITNGSGGYFITADQVAFGGYEVEMFLTRGVQPFVLDADVHYINQTLNHLARVKGE